MKTRTRNLKRLLSLALCLSMMAELLPTAALAADAPAITTEALETATVGEEYTAALAAEASDQKGELTWQAQDLPQWLTLTDNLDGTAVLSGRPAEAGEVQFTVTVTETIPAAEPEDPNQGSNPADPTVLTDTKTYALTVAEAAPANEPETEPGTGDPLLSDSDGGGIRTTYQSVNAAIYTGQGSYGEFTGQTDTFPVDQSGLILDLRDFDQAVSSGWSVESIAFYITACSRS